MIKMQQLIAKLPEVNRNTLRRVMGHLRKYVLKSYCHYVAGVSLNCVVIMARGMNSRHALPIT